MDWEQIKAALSIYLFCSLLAISAALIVLAVGGH